MMMGNSFCGIMAGFVAEGVAGIAPLTPVVGVWHVGGYCAPFDLSALCLVGGFILITATWQENYGTSSSAKSSRTNSGGKSNQGAELQPRAEDADGLVTAGESDQNDAEWQQEDSGGAHDNFGGCTALSQPLHHVQSDLRIQLLGAIITLFEGAMYIFIFNWTPMISATQEETPPFGFIFSIFMVSCAGGSSLFAILVNSVKPESVLRGTFIVAASSFVVMAFSWDAAPTLAAMCVFEACVGVYWPAIGTIKSRVVPEDSRTTIYNIFRVPLNAVVVTVLLSSMSLEKTIKACATMLFFCAVCQILLHANIGEWRTRLSVPKLPIALTLTALAGVHYGLYSINAKASAVRTDGWLATGPPAPPFPPAPPLAPWTFSRDCVKNSSLVRYAAGEVESLWIDPHRAVSHAGHICSISYSAKHLQGVDTWLGYTARVDGAAVTDKIRHSLAAVPGRSPPTFVPLRPVAPEAHEAKALSRFERPNPNGKGVISEYIEPLSGIARHPLVREIAEQCDAAKAPIEGGSAVAAIADLARRFPKSGSKFDINYLVLANGCDENGEPRPPVCLDCDRKPRNLFFDLGCTMYDDGTQIDVGEANGWGPSIPLFFQMYERRCIVFDAIYGWEISPYKAADYWRNVPLPMRSRLHFFNVAVEEPKMADTLAGKWGEPSWLKNPGNFLAMLNETARPSDFVALKVDIEGQLGGPELEIVRAIAETPQLAKLVDEIFFEYHFWFDALNFGWGGVARADEMHLRRQGNVDDALRLLRQLREKGIRSHFWI